MAYSFQKGINAREQDIRERIKSTKEELKEVLMSLEEDFNDRVEESTQIKQNPAAINDEDDMADLSPETR